MINCNASGFAVGGSGVHPWPICREVNRVSGIGGFACLGRVLDLGLHSPPGRVADVTIRRAREKGDDLGSRCLSFPAIEFNVKFTCILKLPVGNSVRPPSGRSTGWARAPFTSHVMDRRRSRPGGIKSWQSILRLLRTACRFVAA